MGHTLATITNHFDRFRSQLSLFRRALRKTDQLVLDELLNEARQHLPAAGYAANVLPEVSFLLCVMLEQHKRARRHEAEFEKLRAEFHEETERLRHELEMQIGNLRINHLLSENGKTKNGQ